VSDSDGPAGNMPGDGSPVAAVFPGDGSPVAALFPGDSSPVAALEAAGRQLVFVTAGGGAEAIAQLATTPGGSGVLLEATVASARQTIDGLLGGPQESYCSSRAARRLAVACWQRARELGSPAAVGLALTAALVTRAPKRGPHRMHVAVQTLDATLVASLGLDKDVRSRAEEERVAAAFALAALATGARPGGAGGGVGDLELAAGLLRPGERIVTDHCAAPRPWQQLFAGERRAVSAGTDTEIDAPAPGGLIFPGSFDPLHAGHRRMASVAEEIAERPVAYELSITNVDKPALDYLEIRDRASQFDAGVAASPSQKSVAGSPHTDRPLWLTRAATFLEKTEIFPKSTFIVGADTFVRLADPRYYGGSRAKARNAARAIARRTRGLIVFGRARDGVFVDPARLEVPRELREVAYFVSEREFRLDVSSTELRQATADA